MFTLLARSTEENEALAKCNNQITRLKSYLQQKTADRDNQILSTVSNETKNEDISIDVEIPSFKLAKKLTGCFGKIYSLCWFPDASNRVLSASQDAKLLVFDVNTKMKIISVELRSAWVMTCCVSPSIDCIVSGGLSNIVNVFKIDNDFSGHIRYDDSVTEFIGHEGYISGVKFIDNTRILSSSGDCSVKLWDLTKEKCVQTFDGINCDIEGVDVNREKSIFVCGAVNANAYLHDYRAKMSSKPIAKFSGHQSDINAVRWFPDNVAFITGSDDATMRLFDMRSFGTLNIYQDANILGGLTSVDCSTSGRYIIGGYDDDPFCVVWDTLTGLQKETLNHPTRASCLQMSPEGDALMTGCWDRLLREWNTKPRIFPGPFDDMSTCALCCLMCWCLCHKCFTCQCCKCKC